MKGQKSNLNPSTFYQSLFKNHGVFDSPSALIIFLMQQKQIQSLSARQFCERLESKIGDYSVQMLKLFKKSHNKELKKFERKFNIIYPWPIQSNQSFENAKLKWFVDEYVKTKSDQQYQQMGFCLWQQQKTIQQFQNFEMAELAQNFQEEEKNQKVQIKNITKLQNSQYLFYFESDSSDGQGEDSKGQMKKMRYEKIPNEKLIYATQDPNIIPYLRMSQDIDQDQQCFQQKRVPNFFLQNGRALNALLAIDITFFFQRQIQQIKKLIREQIQSDENYLILTYKQFLKFFGQLYEMRQGKFDPDSQNLQYCRQTIGQYFSSYFQLGNLKVKYAYGQKKSPFLQIWQPMHKRLIQTCKKFSEDQIRQIILQALQKIYLVMKGENNVYGLTSNLNIFINVHQNQNNYSLEEYRQGPLKPYILLTLYHQLTHYLIRKLFSDVQNSKKRSFYFDDSTLGSQIISLTSTYYQSIKNKLNIKLKLYKTDQFIQMEIINKLRETIDKFYQMIVKYKDWLKVFRNNFEGFHKIKDQVISVCQILTQIKQHKNHQKINKQWLSIYKYIQELQKRQEQKQFNNQLEQKYRFFFVLFLDEKIVCSWIGKKISLEQYKKYRQLLIKLKIKRYFIYQNKLIVALVRKFSQHQFMIYGGLIQNKKGLLQTLNQEIVNYCKIFDINTSFKLQNQLTEFERTMKGELFYDFLIPSIQDKLNKTVDNPFHIRAIFKIESLYNYLMSIVKNADLIAVICQLQICSYDGFQRSEAGVIMERILFPRLHLTNIIHSKDYELIRDIENQQSRKKVGSLPESHHENSSSITVYRARDSNIKVEKFIKLGFCGLQRDQKRLDNKKQKNK